MGWFSELMFGKEKPLGNINKAVEYCRQQAVDSFKVPDVTKDISEPVLAIVKALNQRPSTFKISAVENVNDHTGCFSRYSISDIKTNQSLNVCEGYGYRKSLYIFSWSWITEDEKELMVKTFTELLKHKIERIRSIERAKMKAIYNTKESSK